MDKEKEQQNEIREKLKDEKFNPDEFDENE